MPNHSEVDQLLREATDYAQFITLASSDLIDTRNQSALDRAALRIRQAVARARDLLAECRQEKPN
ncbi:MAG: hypothetical protein COA52_14995 [Hyphomicrobiales bacterium]|nr:MAG: hypothetical protein COA52_14995 [Hyphomicrobiales bacterium]